MSWLEISQALGLAFVIGMIAYVYAVILTDPDHIFENLRKWAERILPPFLFRPLIGCEKCVAGQIALWTLVFKLVKNLWLLHRATGQTFRQLLPHGAENWVDFIVEINFLLGLLVITSAIYFTMIMKKIHRWTNK